MAEPPVPTDPPPDGDSPPATNATRPAIPPSIRAMQRRRVAATRAAVTSREHANAHAIIVRAFSQMKERVRRRNATGPIQIFFGPITRAEHEAATAPTMLTTMTTTTATPLPPLVPRRLE